MNVKLQLRRFGWTRFGAGCAICLWALTTVSLMLFVGLPLLLLMQVAQWFERKWRCVVRPE
jgi:hypothetical protein